MYLQQNDSFMLAISVRLVRFIDLIFLNRPARLEPELLASDSKIDMAVRCTSMHACRRLFVSSARRVGLA